MYVLHLLRLLGTARLINGFKKKLTKADRKSLKKRQEELGICMVKKKVKNGKIQVSGGPALKWSAHYPEEMCATVVSLFRDPPTVTQLQL